MLAKGQLPAGDDHWKDRSVLALVAPSFGSAFPSRSGVAGLPEELSNIGGRTDVEQSHRQEFRPAESIRLDCSLVYFENGERIQIVDPHG